MQRAINDTMQRPWFRVMALRTAIIGFVLALPIILSGQALAKDYWVVTSDGPIVLTYSSSDSGCGTDSKSNNSVSGHCTAGFFESQGMTLKATYTNPDHPDITFYCEVYVTDPTVGDMSAGVGDFDTSKLEQAYCNLMDVKQTTAPGKDYAWHVSVIASPATGNGTSGQ